jgi:hypothetical protein
MFANSLLILFSSSSRARAFLRSAINDTSPAPKYKPLSKEAGATPSCTSHSRNIARLVPAEQAASSS